MIIIKKSVRIIAGTLAVCSALLFLCSCGNKEKTKETAGEEYTTTENVENTTKEKTTKEQTTAETTTRETTTETTTVNSAAGYVPYRGTPKLPTKIDARDIPEYTQLMTLLDGASTEYYPCDYDKTQFTVSVKGNPKPFLNGQFSYPTVYGCDYNQYPGGKAKFDEKDDLLCTIKKEKLIWISENIFNCTREATEKAIKELVAEKSEFLNGEITVKDNGDITFHGGCDSGYGCNIIDFIVKGDYYYFKYNAYCDPCSYNAIGYAKLKLKDIDGKQYWSFYDFDIKPF